MPKLPGGEDMGGGVSGRAGRPIASLDTSAIGRGIASLGEGIGSLAAGVKANEKVKKAEVDQATRFETQRRFLEFAAAQDDALVKEGQNAAPGAFGFREGYTGAYQQAAKEFFATVPEELKPEYDVKLFQVEDGLSGRALTFERQQRKDYYTSSVNEGLTKIENKLYANPKAFDINLREGDEFISSIPDEDISPIDKEAMRKDWRKKAQLAALYGMPAAERVDAIQDAPELSGTVVDRIIGVESGGKADAKNPLSSATGLGQFTSGTWLATVRKHEPALLEGRSQAEVLALRNDPTISRRMTGHLVADNSAALSAAGVPVNDATVYLAHFAGAGGAIAVLKADPNTSVASILGGPAVRANPFLSGKTARDLVAWAGKKMAGGGVDPRFADMPWQDREKIIAGAETEIRQEEADRRVSAQFAIETAAANAPVAIQNTGTYTGVMPTEEQFMAAYGAEAGQKWNAFQQALETSQSAFRMQTMPAEEVSALVSSAEPTSSGDDAALQQARYDTLSRAADATLKAREADPAAYVRRAFPSVDKAWQGVTEPGGYQAAVAASVAAQQQLGVKDIRPLPKEIAATAVENFKDENLSEQNRIASATNVLMATADKGQRQALFEQLVDAGLPDITEGAFEAMARGDQGAASRLFRAAMTDPSKLPGKLPETLAAIDAAIQSALMDDGMIGDVYYGLTNGTAENLARAERDSKLITNAVGLRMRSGEDMDAAIQSVAKDLYGDVQVVTGNGEVNAEFVLPAGEDADAVLSGLAAEMPKVRDAVQSAVMVPDAPTADGSRAVVDAVTSGYADDVLAEGYFRHTDGGYVFIDPFTGDPVPGVDGMPMVFKPSVVPSAAEKTPFSGRAVDDAAARQGAFQ